MSYLFIANRYIRTMRGVNKDKIKSIFCLYYFGVFVYTKIIRDVVKK